MATKRLKRAFYTALIGAAVILGITALALLGQTAQNSEQFGRLHDVLLLVNAAGAIVLLVLIVGNLIRLWREYRGEVPGAKLKARMLDSHSRYSRLLRWRSYIFSPCSF